MKKRVKFQIFIYHLPDFTWKSFSGSSLYQTIQRKAWRTKSWRMRNPLHASVRIQQNNFPTIVTTLSWISIIFNALWNALWRFHVINNVCNETEVWVKVFFQYVIYSIWVCIACVDYCSILDMTDWKQSKVKIQKIRDKIISRAWWFLYGQLEGLVEG